MNLELGSLVFESTQTLARERLHNEDTQRQQQTACRHGMLAGRSVSSREADLFAGFGGTEEARRTSFLLLSGNLILGDKVTLLDWRVRALCLRALGG